MSTLPSNLMEVSGFQNGHKVAHQVVTQRIRVLKSFAPNGFLSNPEVRQAIKFVKRKAAELKRIPSPTWKEVFFSDLIVAATRVWEAFGQHPDGNARFPEYAHDASRVVMMLVDDAGFVREAFRTTASLVVKELPTPASATLEFALAKADILNHRDTVVEIVGHPFSDHDLDAFFNEVHLLTFGVPVQENEASSIDSDSDGDDQEEEDQEDEASEVGLRLLGLSSPNGKRVYFNAALLTTRSGVQAWDRNVCGVLAHEMMHNFPRWLRGRTANAEQEIESARFISAEQNSNLRVDGIWWRQAIIMPPKPITWLFLNPAHFV